MTLQSSKNGLLTIPKNAVIHTIPEPESNKGNVQKKFTSWSSTDIPMFVKDELSVADIHQGQIGDCWFLAAAAAVVDKADGTKLIKQTMVDCGDDWCIVRLYGGDNNPVYIKTRKTRASFLGAKYGSSPMPARPVSGPPRWKKPLPVSAARTVQPSM